MTEKTKRDAPISYRPPKELWEEFVRRVEASGLPVNAFITSAVFGLPPPRRSRHPPAEKKMLAQLLFQAAAIRDRLDMVADRVGEGELSDAFDDLAVIRAALLKMMERAP